jgi:antitoxin CptB
MPMNAKQLVWRCRRGVRELDVIFGRFLESHYPALNEQEKAAFERLLDIQDPVIMDWLFERAHTSDAEMDKLIHVLREMSGLNA